MFITLKKDWFGPDGTLREVRNNPHEVPDSWAGTVSSLVKEEEKKEIDKDARVLPSSAKIVGKGQTVDVERYTADGSVVIETQAVDDDTDVGALDGKAGEPKAPSTVQMPTYKAATPTPMATPTKK